MRTALKALGNVLVWLWRPANERVIGVVLVALAFGWLES